MLRRNVGGIDRVLRVTLGAILFLAGLFLLAGKATLGVIVTVVGLLALLTGVVRFCALYIPFGISTARSGEQRINQRCDCELFLKELKNQQRAGKPPAASEEEVADAGMTMGRQGH